MRSKITRKVASASIWELLTISYHVLHILGGWATWKINHLRLIYLMTQMTPTFAWGSLWTNKLNLSCGRLLSSDHDRLSIHLWAYYVLCQVWGTRWNKAYCETSFTTRICNKSWLHYYISLHWQDEWLHEWERSYGGVHGCGTRRRISGCTGIQRWLAFCFRG